MSNKVLTGLVVALSLLSFAGSVSPEITNVNKDFAVTKTVHIHGDFGGQIKFYLNRWADYKNSQVVFDGGCLSACTMFTSLPKVCITKTAMLGFHQGTKPVATRTMKMMWSDKIRAYVEKQGELPTFESGEYIILQYDELKNLLPTCS